MHMAPPGNTKGLGKNSLAMEAEKVQGRQVECCSLSSGPWGQGAILLDTPGRSSHILASWQVRIPPTPKTQES